jgi:hypothetical protein
LLGLAWAFAYELNELECRQAFGLGRRWPIPAPAKTNVQRVRDGELVKTTTKETPGRQLAVVMVFPSI